MRRFDDRRAEVFAVKAALAAAGITARVGHGAGTAWGWLEINVGAGAEAYHETPRDTAYYVPCPPSCGECRRVRTLTERVREIAREVTGRTGEYDGNTNIMHQDHWDRAARRSVPIDQTGEWAPEAWASAEVLARLAREEH